MAHAYRETWLTPARKRVACEVRRSAGWHQTKGADSHADDLGLSLDAMSRSASFFAATLLASLPLLQGCVADQGSADVVASPAALPSSGVSATYDCGADGAILLRAGSGTVDLMEADGTSYALAAAPPGQNTRFGAEGYALVLEGREALWMKAGSEPATCRS
jgi:hypothetical protein